MKNVPSNAELRVQVLDKDDGAKDDYIGKFTTDVKAGAKEEEIEGPVFKRNKGTFWLKVRVFSFRLDTPFAEPLCDLFYRLKVRPRQTAFLNDTDTCSMGPFDFLVTSLPPSVA